MSQKLCYSSLLATVFLVTAGCNRYDKTHEFIQDGNTDVRFEESAAGDDKFIMKLDYLDFDGESVEIMYRGDFRLDSVQKAVERFQADGTLPLEADLH